MGGQVSKIDDNLESVASESAAIRCVGLLVWCEPVLFLTWARAGSAMNPSCG